MNIDDLRQTLATMAEEVDATDQTNRVQPVQSKVATASRRRDLR